MNGLLKSHVFLQLEDEKVSSDDEDEDKYVDKMDMVGTKVDAAERYTVRNLRIREDTAKYLRNLDPNSAHYDPKTRSMRKNPYEHSGKAEDEVRAFRHSKYFPCGLRRVGFHSGRQGNLWGHPNRSRIRWEILYSVINELNCKGYFLVLPPVDYHFKSIAQSLILAFVLKLSIRFPPGGVRRR